MPYVTPLSYFSAGHNVAEMPDPGSFSYLTGCVDNCGFMGKGRFRTASAVHVDNSAVALQRFLTGIQNLQNLDSVVSVCFGVLSDSIHSGKKLAADPRRRTQTFCSADQPASPEPSRWRAGLAEQKIHSLRERTALFLCILMILNARYIVLLRMMNS